MAKKKAAKAKKAKKPMKINKPKKAAKSSFKTDRSAAKKTRALANVPRTPSDRTLPGLEDRAIRELEDIGSVYADIRDQRIRLSREEGSLKDTAKKVMHKHNKTVYRSKTIEIVLTAGEEDIKVKIRKDDGQDALPAANQPAGEAIATDDGGMNGDPFGDADAPAGEE